MTIETERPVDTLLKIWRQYRPINDDKNKKGIEYV